jgi:hypothetical protein
VAISGGVWVATGVPTNYFPTGHCIGTEIEVYAMQMCDTRFVATLLIAPAHHQSGLDQFVESDWQIAHQFPDRVVQGIRYRRDGSGDSNLADALDAQGFHIRVVFVDEQHVDRADVRDACRCWCAGHLA